jgi:pSer/pThr/pTyr-binding forkhead associated (FHA) protein
MRIVVIDGPDRGMSFELAGVLVLGRDQSAGIVIDDPEVSRRHVSMSAKGDEVEIEDLDSMNGTWVSGERIEDRRTVTAGDKIRIGHTVLQIVAPPAETVEAPEPEQPDEHFSQRTRIAGDASESNPS